jgi:hypothetical protein
MTIRTVYVKATSKKTANEVLAGQEVGGAPLMCTEYSPTDMTTHRLDSMPDGTVIKIYAKIICGSPFAKAYGNWSAKKQKIV